MMGWRPSRPILMTVDPIGGVWSYALNLCKELDPCEIVLASMGRALNSAERTQIKALPNVELFESTFKLEWMKDPWRDVAAAGEWLKTLAGRVQPSSIHLNQFSHGALDWKVPCLVVGHSCVYSWYEAVKGAPPGKEWQTYKRMVARGLRGADKVTAPSRSMLSSLKKNYGGFIAAEPIYNGADPARFVPATKAEFILTAGRLWDEAKNIAILDWTPTKLTWPIYAAGDVAAPDGVRTHLKNLRLLGPLDAPTLAHWMGRAPIFVLPAHYEPFGLTVLEAALAGCALVLGDIPSLREIWQDAALFAPAGDSEAIAAALKVLISDAPLRRRLARRARSRALTFSPQRTARAYLALYREMLTPQKSPVRERDCFFTSAESPPEP